MSRKLSVNTLYLLFRLGEKSRVTTHWNAGFLGALSELFDICGLPLLLSNHFSLAGMKRYKTSNFRLLLIKVRLDWAGEAEFGFFQRGIQERSVDWPCLVLWRDKFFSAITDTVPFFSSCPPGGLFHRNVQGLQRVNRPDRPGRVNWWAEGEGDRGQAQRVACSVHCRRWLREESRKKREELLSCRSVNGLHSFEAPSFAQIKRTAAALTWLSACFHAASSTPIPLALHSHVSFSDSLQLKAAEMPH